MAKQRTSLATILSQIPAARAREARARREGRRAVAVHFDRKSGRIMMELTSGIIFGFPANSISALAKATPAQLAAVELGPGGGGLHWEELDADLSVPGLLLSAIGRSQKLAEFGRLAGQVKSPAKAAASRANGAKGGRPRKAAGR
jgi:hypothetical protein